MTNRKRRKLGDSVTFKEIDANSLYFEGQPGDIDITVRQDNCLGLVDNDEPIDPGKSPGFQQLHRQLRSESSKK